VRRVVALLLLAAPAYAEPTHRDDQRVAYIAGALAAVRAASTEALDRASEYARMLGRGACASPVQRLRAECLMTASRRYCQKKSAECAPTMDVLVSNLLGESQMISTEMRYQIMSREKDYRRAIAREIRRQEGVLAVDFRLRTGDAASSTRLAANIDRYCVASADETNLAWQTCVSSLVWFIARGE
jgi:hypothetical protein